MSKQHFDEAYGLKAPENYERYFVPVIGEPLAHDLLRITNLQQGERVLDVACGTGIVARLASEKVGSTGSVTGLDINPGMLAVARSIAPPGKMIEWYEAGAEAIPLPDAVFDVVMCQLGFQFMTDKITALKEMKRVLVPGGRIALNVPGPVTPIFTILAGALERHISAEAAGFAKHVFSLHDTTEIKTMMNTAGFENVVIHEAYKELQLPAPRDFLWQYVYASPLAGIVTAYNEEAKNALENEVVGKWQDFLKDGAFIYKQRIVTVTAYK